MISNLKRKLLKFNFISIILVAFAIAFLFAFITYKLLEDIIKTSNFLTKDFYIKTQKNIIKNQVNNFVLYVKHLRVTKQKDVISYVERIINISANNIKYSKNPKKALATFSKFNNLKMVYIKNGKIIFENTKIDLSKIDFHKHLQKIGDNYYLIKKIDNNSFFVVLIEKSKIDELVKKEAISYLYTIRFGSKNNGYISIAEILNYKGGKRFARVVALPVKPQWVGKYLDDSKKDAKGKPYRKEYLKIANTTGEGYVSYWFFKKKDKKMHPKISYVKLYKPFNWLIFSSVYIDDIDSIIKQRNEIFYQHIKDYIYIYLFMYMVILGIIILLAFYENKIFKQLITEYENKIEEKSIKLKNINKNLAKMVNEKTKQILEEYFKDNLTGLPNREKLLTDLGDNYVAILNINSFKEINDFYGVEVGDELLKDVAKILPKFTDNLYKLAADEFAILEKVPAKLVNLGKKINFYFSENSLKIENEEIFISFRIGIGKNLQEADLSLKYAKEKGKNIIVFNKNLPILKEFENNIRWRKIIYEAIKNDYVIPYLQAIVDNKTKEVIKYECLMRIKYEGKIYTPYFFLDVARKTNQYEKLQRIMIEKCFKKFSKIRKEFSINLETLDFENEQFKNWLLEKIDKYKVGDILTIELLENSNIVDNEDVRHFIKELKERNVKVAIDDFGSGYSNFIYLIKDLSADIVKIDGSITKEIDKKEIYILLQKIIEIAKTFNFATIAEFVENEEIYQKLKEIGVDASQGYYFSKPFSIDEL